MLDQRLVCKDVVRVKRVCLVKYTGKAAVIIEMRQLYVVVVVCWGLSSSYYVDRASSLEEVCPEVLYFSLVGSLSHCFTFIAAVR